MEEGKKTFEKKFYVEFFKNGIIFILKKREKKMTRIKKFVSYALNTKAAFSSTDVYPKQDTFN